MSKNKNRFISTNKTRDVAVDIVTPVYGSIKYLRSMVESFRKFDAGISWSLTLADDVGPEREETEALYNELSSDYRIRVVRNSVNSGFAVTNNLGFAQGRADLCLLLNSDTLITRDNWLRDMAEEFKDTKVGVVGVKLLFFDPECPNYVASPIRPDGKVQHAGVAFNMVGNPFHIFMNWDADHPKVTVRREMNCVTAACMMTRRKIYKTLNGLDPVYGQGNFEDVQFCLQARANGYKIIYTPDVMLRHFHGGSNNNAVAQKNLQIFQVRCRNLIEYDDWRYY